MVIFHVKAFNCILFVSFPNNIHVHALGWLLNLLCRPIPWSPFTNLQLLVIRTHGAKECLQPM